MAADLQGFRFPTRDIDLVRACGLCRHDANLKVLAFESLLYAPLAVLVDLGKAPPALSPRIIDCSENPAVPVQVRKPAAGIPEFSNAVFSDLAWFHAFMPDRQNHCLVIEDSVDLIAQLASMRYPLVIDPSAPHALVLTREEMAVWFMTWQHSTLAADPLERGDCTFKPAPSAPPQRLLDRLGALLPRFEAVESAYLIHTGSLDRSGGAGQLALAVACADAATLMRIRRALPLLAEGLDSQESPRWFVPLLRHPGLARDVMGLVPPIYSQAMGQWLRASPP